jgi:hypothetical protein
LRRSAKTPVVIELAFRRLAISLKRPNIFPDFDSFHRGLFSHAIEVVNTLGLSPEERSSGASQPEGRHGQRDGGDLAMCAEFSSEAIAVVLAYLRALPVVVPNAYCDQ